jgi:hypothetical protein
MVQDEEKDKALADAVDTIKRTIRRRKLTLGGANWQQELQEKQSRKRKA